MEGLLSTGPTPSNFVHPLVCVYLFVRLSGLKEKYLVCVFVFFFVFVFLFVFVGLFVCLFVCLLVCLFVCLFICLFV